MINIELNKTRIQELWHKVDRPGVGNLLSYLESTDFYTAPCSKDHHLNIEGGLVEHELHVYTSLDKMFHGESAIVCALGHDLCKIEMYKKGGRDCSDAQWNYFKNLKTRCNGPKWVLMREKGYDLDNYRPSATFAGLLIDWMSKGTGAIPEEPLEWTIEDKLPLGHGEKSLYILSKFISLTDEEALAIRWHMGGFISGLMEYDMMKSYNKAQEITPLVGMLHIADMYASLLMERDDTK